MKTEILDGLRALCEAAATPREGALPEWLARRAQPCFDTVATDAAGNVVCHKKGPGKKLMVSASMDVPGLVALSIDEKGFVHFAAPGVAAVGLLPGAVVRFPGGAAGVVCPGPGVGITATPPEKLEARDLRIDLGVAGRPEAEKLAAPGQVAVPDCAAQALAGGSLLVSRAQALVPCLVAALAMEQMAESPNDLYFVFTAHGSGDMQGGTVAANTLRPDLCVSLALADGSEPEKEKEGQNPRPGGGPVVPFRQARILYSAPAVDFISGVAEAAKIPCQTALSLAGNTDATAIQRAGGGVLTGGLGVAARHLGQPGVVVSAADIDQAADLLTKVIVTAIP